MITAVVLLTLGCKEQETPETENEGNWPAVQADYKVWATEGDSMVTCMIQFYSGPKKRQAVRLFAPAEVSVDGITLKGDSAGRSGVYYEYRAPLAAFAGPHAIRFKDGTGRAFVDTFYYTVFKILALPQPTQNDYFLKLEGLPGKRKVRVVLTDTAFDHEGYNEFLPVTKGKLVIDSAILKTLKKGPVQLHLAAEEDRPLGSGLPGSISISYSISRSFELSQ